ncbi:hypothetical protein [Bacillus massiliigorillae]|uniref:hypothetical protein n=1 Tax=Bacillus massiliigorillae TaxID=1243664 RepID=UPI00039E20CE|nr:hypothetical protein [Bacillus massiliigorillae]
MRKIYILTLPLLLMITISSDSYEMYSTFTKSNILDQSTLQVVENIYFSNLFYNPNVRFSDQTIYIDLEVDRNILELKPVEQFMKFEIFTRRLRFILKNHSNVNGATLSSKNIIINAQSTRNSFIFNSKSLNKKLIYLTDSYLLLNQKIIFSSSEFNRVSRSYFSNIIEKVNGYDDIEIIRYARKLFEIMTSNGKYYDPKKDNKLILDAICDKFNITNDEYFKIENKYYLFGD